jgi:Asp-tRNA(Asn)/Glu-tRNA(Gln) amidotransferase A subunit family amidase
MARRSAGRVSNIGHFPRIGALHDVRRHRSRSGPGTARLGRRRRGGERLRVAWLTHDDPGHPSDAVAEHVKLAVRALADAGATVVADGVPAHLAEALDITKRYWDRRQLSGPEADDLLWDWDRFRRRQLEFAQTVDIVVSPATPDVADEPRKSPGNPEYVYLLPASLTGAPAATVPTGLDGTLPIGIQLIGPRWHDATVLAAARVIETAVASATQ